MRFVFAFIGVVVLTLSRAAARRIQVVQRGETTMSSVRMSAPTAVERWTTVQEFVAARRTNSPLADLPIRTDVRGAIGLGMQHMNSLFDRDRDDEPFFYANCRADGTGEMHHSVNIGIPHVVGRCLLGCLDGEETTGLPCPKEGLAILERYLRQSFENEDHLNSYIDPARANGRFIEFHNMREGLYGLVMLMRVRHSGWARDTAAKMVRTLDALTDEAGHWSIDRARARGMADRCEGLSPPNAGRVVDPLVEYYELTKDPVALKLAGLYSRCGLQAMYEPDGRFVEDWQRSSGHVHSITSSLSGITRYAILVHDQEMSAWCRRILAKGVPEYFSSWGWGDEVYPAHPANVVGRGEINQTGDVIRTALAMGAAGDTDCYDTAERYLRSMLLPAQHREADLRRFLNENENPRSDAERDVLRRSIGGFGFPLPNAGMREGDWPITTLDITSGGVHALSECYRDILTHDGRNCRLNLLFDCEDRDFSVKSHLPLEGRVDFTAHSKKRLLIRIPGWVDRATVVIHVGSRDVKPVFENGYLAIARLSPDDQGTLTFSVPCKVETEVVDGTTYTTTWIGDQIIEITPRGKVSPLPF